jgi:hypothetical protein
MKEMKAAGTLDGQGKRGKHLAAFIITENWRYISENVSSIIFLWSYLADVEQYFK